MTDYQIDGYLGYSYMPGYSNGEPLEMGFNNQAASWNSS
jgi:hypothetical protein